jgi:hypothetical protein
MDAAFDEWIKRDTGEMKNLADASEKMASSVNISPRVKRVYALMWMAWNESRAAILAELREEASYQRFERPSELAHPLAAGHWDGVEWVLALIDAKEKV